MARRRSGSSRAELPNGWSATRRVRTAHGRRGVTAVHKANILKITDGLFLKVARRWHRTTGDRLQGYDRRREVHAARRPPEAYDVLVTTNLFGDIVSDLCAGWVGGSLRAWGQHGETWRSSSPFTVGARHAGKGIANPIATIPLVH